MAADHLFRGQGRDLLKPRDPLVGRLKAGRVGHPRMCPGEDGNAAQNGFQCENPQEDMGRVVLGLMHLDLFAFDDDIADQSIRRDQFLRGVVAELILPDRQLVGFGRLDQPGGLRCGHDTGIGKFGAQGVEREVVVRITVRDEDRGQLASDCLDPIRQFPRLGGLELRVDQNGFAFAVDQGRRDGEDGIFGDVSFCMQ